MLVGLYKEELDELIKIHRSAAIRAAAVGDWDKVKHHEDRAKFLVSEGGYAGNDPNLEPVIEHNG